MGLSGKSSIVSNWKTAAHSAVQLLHELTLPSSDWKVSTSGLSAFGITDTAHVSEMLFIVVKLKDINSSQSKPYDKILYSHLKILYHENKMTFINYKTDTGTEYSPPNELYFCKGV